MTGVSPPGVDWAALDQRAWDLIRHWPEAAGFDPVRDGLDYGHLTRWYLWDRVARALRREHAPEAFKLECTLLEQSSAPARKHTSRRGVSRASRLARVVARSAPNLTLPFKARASAPSRFEKGGPRGIYLPLPNARVNAIAERLAQDPDLRVVAGPHALTPPEGIPRISPVPANGPDTVFTARLYDAILAGLRAQQLELESRDAASLRACLDEQARHIPIVGAELDALCPAVVLVHADNHPRPIHYVLHARKRGIPVFLLQHGLDCERYYLDDAYATHIAVWGSARAERYRRDSAEEPVLSITGNPAWDSFRAPASMSPKGDAWLWVTRPHSPDKCYAPSRLCGEGLAILEALLDALERHPARSLRIKPHPYDYPALYAAVIAARGLQARVTLTDEPVLDLLPRARVVITEDSTAGLEAMLFGKPLVHAHFAATAPTAAFSESGAALPAFSHEQLEEALDRIEAFSDADCAAMHAQQRRFLEAHAGPLDGAAMPRVAEALRAVALRP